jgi:hypothetical protein
MANLVTTYLQPALPFALEEKRQESPVRVGAGAVVDLAFFHGALGGGVVVQQPQHALGLGVAGVVELDEVVVGEPQSAREAEHQLLADGLHAVHEALARLLEPGQVLVAHPQALLAFRGGGDHVLAELQLVRLLDVGRAGGGSDLGHLLVADVLRVPRHGGLDGVRQGEEGLGGAEDGVLLRLGDAMVDDGEEADVFGRVDELGCDLVCAGVKVGERNLKGVSLRCK